MLYNYFAQYFICTNKDGDALNSIKVTLVRTSTGESNLENYYFTTSTDANGSYEIVIPQGTYEMNISDAK